MSWFVTHSFIKTEQPELEASGWRTILNVAVGVQLCWAWRGGRSSGGRVSSYAEGGQEELSDTGEFSCPLCPSTRAQAGAPEAVGKERPPHLSLVHPLGCESPINRLPGARGIELRDLCPAGTAPSASSLALWGHGLAGWGLQTALWLPW